MYKDAHCTVIRDSDISPDSRNLELFRSRPGFRNRRIPQTRTSEVENPFGIFSTEVPRPCDWRRRTPIPSGIVVPAGLGTSDSEVLGTSSPVFRNPEGSEPPVPKSLWETINQIIRSTIGACKLSQVERWTLNPSARGSNPFRPVFRICLPQARFYVPKSRSG